MGVFVGLLRFPDELLPTAVEHQKQTQGGCRQGLPPSCVSAALLLHSNLVGEPAAEPFASALSPGRVLSHGTALYFGWQSGDLYLAARDDSDLPSERPIFMVVEDGCRSVTLDVAACSSAFKLNYRNVEVAINGRWKKCSTGLFVMTEDKAATIAELSAGVPCVIHVRLAQTMQHQA